MLVVVCMFMLVVIVSVFISIMCCMCVFFLRWYCCVGLFCVGMDEINFLWFVCSLIVDGVVVVLVNVVIFFDDYVVVYGI